jgi:hypothetical protein
MHGLSRSIIYILTSLGLHGFRLFAAATAIGFVLLIMAYFVAPHALDRRKREKPEE